MVKRGGGERVLEGRGGLSNLQLNLGNGNVWFCLHLSVNCADCAEVCNKPANFPDIAGSTHAGPSHAPFPCNLII